MITARTLYLAFGSRIILNNISFTCTVGQRIGLVGLNGSGKSTLLQVISNPTLLDSGVISCETGKKIAYMPQEMVLLSTKTVFEEAFSAHEHLYTLEQERIALEEIFTNTNLQKNTPELITRYAYVQEQLRMFNIAQARVQTREILIGLGFTETAFLQDVSTLSVGWKMRIILAQLLLKNADFYLFDEPTNHLDIFAAEWFLRFLQQAPFGFLLVSHERHFLDTVCDYMLELEQGAAVLYKGNLSAYKQQKEKQVQAHERAYKQQQKERAKKQETINRFRASATKAALVQSMIKSLEKSEPIQILQQQRTITIPITPPPKSGRSVLTVKNIRYCFQEQPLFTAISFDIERGEKVALIAPNGRGKSTLLHIITGTHTPAHGTITFGHNVISAFFAQDQTKVLCPDNTILEELEQACPTKSIQAIRALLGAFLFTQDDISKKIKVLSGGEKNRVSMVRVLLRDANFLILDEPTNHLDIPSKEVLLQALQEFKGTILFVSHDRDFVDGLATRVIELTKDKAISYPGNYSSYVLFKNTSLTPSYALPGQPETLGKPTSTTMSADLFKLRKESSRLEEKIDKLEKELHILGQQLSVSMYGTDPYTQYYDRYIQLEEICKKAYDQWEELQNRIQILTTQQKV